MPMVLFAASMFLVSILPSCVLVAEYITLPIIHCSTMWPVPLFN